MVEGCVAECFWPGVRPADVDALDRRVAAAVAELGRSGGRCATSAACCCARTRSCLCRFAGPLAPVEAVALQARVPYERLLATLATGETVPA